MKILAIFWHRINNFLKNFSFQICVQSALNSEKCKSSGLRLNPDWGAYSAPQTPAVEEQRGALRAP